MRQQGLKRKILLIVTSYIQWFFLIYDPKSNLIHPITLLKKMCINFLSQYKMAGKIWWKKTFDHKQKKKIKKRYSVGEKKKEYEWIWYNIRV